MNSVRVSRTVALEWDYNMDGSPKNTVEVSVEFDPSNERDLVRNMAALTRAVAELESREENRCPGCFVGLGVVHTLECPYAPDAFMDLLRAEMNATA